MKVDKVCIYRDHWDEYRWKRVAPNGRIVGASTEGYKRKIDCVKNFHRSYKEGFVIEEDI